MCFKGVGAVCALCSRIDLSIDFHQEVFRSFEGPSLAKLLASNIAKRLVDDGVPIGDLRRAGYPVDVVQSVKKEMATFGVGGQGIACGSM